MKKYRVYFTKILTYHVDVEANNLQEIEDAVHSHSDDIELDCMDINIDKVEERS